MFNYFNAYNKNSLIQIDVTHCIGLTDILMILNFFIGLTLEIAIYTIDKLKLQKILLYILLNKQIWILIFNFASPLNFQAFDGYFFIHK